MGKNSDFIHSYVPWVSFQRDGFKYHLKYKEKVSLKWKTALVIWPATHSTYSNVWYIQGILSLITKGTYAIQREDTHQRLKIYLIQKTKR